MTHYRQWTAGGTLLMLAAIGAFCGLGVAGIAAIIVSEVAAAFGAADQDMIQQWVWIVVGIATVPWSVGYAVPIVREMRPSDHFNA